MQWACMGCCRRRESIRQCAPRGLHAVPSGFDSTLGWSAPCPLSPHPPPPHPAHARPRHNALTHNTCQRPLAAAPAWLPAAGSSQTACAPGLAQPPPPCLQPRCWWLHCCGGRRRWRPWKGPPAPMPTATGAKEGRLHPFYPTHAGSRCQSATLVREQYTAELLQAVVREAHS